MAKNYHTKIYEANVEETKNDILTLIKIIREKMASNGATARCFEQFEGEFETLASQIESDINEETLKECGSVNDYISRHENLSNRDKDKLSSSNLKFIK